MIEIEEVHQEIINAGNIILKNLGSDVKIDKAEYFFTDRFYFLFLKEAFPNVEFEINENATTSEEMASNIDAILEFLSKRLLEIDLSHIQGIKIVNGSIDHVTKLLQLLYELSMLINEKQNTSRQGSVRESGADHGAQEGKNTPSEDIQMSLRELLRNNKPPFLKGAWRYKLKKQFRPYDSDIEEANKDMNDYVLNDKDILNKAESVSHLRISDLLPDSVKGSQMQDESSKRTQELKSWSDTIPKEEIKGENVIEDDADTQPKKSVSKIEEVEENKESSTCEDKGTDENKRKKAKRKKQESKKTEKINKKQEVPPPPKNNPKHFVFGKIENNAPEEPLINEIQQFESESENAAEEKLNHSSPCRLQNVEENSVHNELDIDEGIAILKQQLKDTMNGEDDIKIQTNTKSPKEEELDEDKIYAIKNRPSNVPGKNKDSSNSATNKSQPSDHPQDLSNDSGLHSDKNAKKNAKNRKKEGKPKEDKSDSKKASASKAKPKSNQTPAKSKQSSKKNSSHTSSHKQSKREGEEGTPKVQQNNYMEQEQADDGLNKENELLQKLNERMEDNKEIKEKIIRQSNQLKQYVKEAKQSGVVLQNKKSTHEKLLQVNLKREIKSLNIKEKKLQEYVERQQRKRAMKRDSRQMQICQKISKLCVQLEREKLRDEQKRTAEERKERISQKSSILELIEKFYSDQINEVKDQIKREKYERQITESSQRQALQNLVKEIKNSKVKELEDCINCLDQEDCKYDLYDDDKIEEEFLKMYKNV